jgi:hypothetical protein
VKHSFLAVPATSFDKSETPPGDFFNHDFGSIGGDDYLAGRWHLNTLVQACGKTDTRHLLLAYFGRNPWRALEAAGCSNVDDLKEDVAYDCVVLEETRHAFVPTGIQTTVAGLDKYRENYESGPPRFGIPVNMEHLCSVDRYEDKSSHDAEETLSRFQRLVLGSGYTSFCLPSDGTSEIEPVYVNLDNGDRLLGFAFNLYSK